MKSSEGRVQDRYRLIASARHTSCLVGDGRCFLLICSRRHLGSVPSGSSRRWKRCTSSGELTVSTPTCIGQKKRVSALLGRSNQKTLHDISNNQLTLGR